MAQESDRRSDKVVATGTWLYDGTVPRRITIHAKPARYASSRYDDDYLDERQPIPDTKDGFLYYCWPGQSGEHLTIEDAKAWADDLRPENSSKNG